MNLNNILAIVKKELRTYFDSPTAYIVLLVFLLLWQFLFFRDAFLIAEASLRNMMSYLPWLFLILIPALTMGSFANEKVEGTLEFLLTHPIKPLEIILGKFLSSLVFVALALAFVFPVAFSFSQFGQLDWGVVVGQYIAALLLAGTLISLGVFVSSVLANQISALLVSASASFFLIIIGLEIVTLSFPGNIATILERLSAYSHFISMARGVIDLRDVWYFISAIIIFLSLAYLQMLKSRLGNRRSLYQNYIIATVLFIGITVLLNVLGDRVPGRLDLTQEQMYQLSPATKEILTSLEDVVIIRLYVTSDLPAQLRPVLRDTQDILRDYQLFSNGRVKIETKDPSRDEAASREAATLGVREVQFNVIGQEELQFKRGYFGLAIVYAAGSEVIPIVNTATDLEYQLTSFIRKLTSPNKKTVAFLEGFGQKDYTREYQLFTSELEKSYNVRGLDLTDEQDPLTNSLIDTLIVAGPTETIDEEFRTQLADYLTSGGSVLMLLDGAIVDQQSLTATTNDNSLADFLPSFGLGLNQDIVFDPNSNQTLTFAGPDGQGFIMPYPFWPRVIADSNTQSTLTKQIRSLVLPWPASLSVDSEKIAELGLKYDRLFVTSPFASNQVGVFDISPDQQVRPTQIEAKTMAVSLIGENAESSDNLPRLIVVGSSNFLVDAIAQNATENLAFGLEAVSWLAQDQSLAGIQLKQRQPRTLLFEDKTQMSLVRYGNMGFAFAAPVLVAAARLFRRNNLKQLKYTKHD